MNGSTVRIATSISHLFGGFLKWGYPNSWMVYFMENPIKVDDLGGTPILGNLHFMVPM